MTLLVRLQSSGHILLTHFPDDLIAACHGVVLRLPAKDWAALVDAAKAGKYDPILEAFE